MLVTFGVFGVNLVPTLCVGTRDPTLCVVSQNQDAERPGWRSHAERGNENDQFSFFTGAAFVSLNPSKIFMIGLSAVLTMILR